MTFSITEKTQPTPPSIDGSKFWAVIIGIDDYKTYPLRGCVSDAEMVFKYLSEDICVPGDHIQFLLSTDIEECDAPGNQPPTRANIVNALLDLSTNPDIRHGDNIIIYFAGHGTTYKCADYSPYQEKAATKLGSIDALCPLDRSSQDTASHNKPDTNDAESLGPSDTHIPDISDREINAILTEIARNEGRSHHVHRRLLSFSRYHQSTKGRSAALYDCRYRHLVQFQICLALQMRP
ncbi:hypothetical protein IW261DRAFT_833975 [Armillaria novae-zelandiae]|uniref:Peptidase C14 caspase domain-containing protein n=1 Tax=Armillaria novae-zelandiae TaxID=153914 RepID=A0AA39NTF3_9AGAR|nr:hypothetical protein IW261DRAFT_833975 [Armillaria novae-zelandiae]